MSTKPHATTAALTAALRRNALCVFSGKTCIDLVDAARVADAESRRESPWCSGCLRQLAAQQLDVLDGLAADRARYLGRVAETIDAARSIGGLL